MRFPSHWLLLAAALVAAPRPAWARKEAEPIYEDPFDIGGGGAELTRASKEGLVLANPALLGLGGANLRWLGETTSLLANKESISTAREVFNASRSGSSSSQSSAEQQQQVTDFTNKVLQNPVHVGWGQAVGFVSSLVGVTAFSRFEPDIRARQYGATGLPEVEFRSESYQGAAVGVPIPTDLRWLKLGVTAKYLMANEQDIVADVTDEATIASFRDPSFVQSVTGLNKGFGGDAGALIFLQGDATDLLIAAKVDDIGNTKLTGPADNPKEFKQVDSAGLGLTLHTGADAIHFAVDYRDITNAYQQEMFKRVYMGTKILVHNHLGLSAGFYNGYPSYGAEIDLWLLRLAGTAYTRELGDHPGVDPRHIYMGSLSFGF